MSDRSINFVEYIIKRVEGKKGNAASLRRADNPSTEYQAWEILASFGVKLDLDSERLPFVTVAAAIARAKPKTNGNARIGRAITRCYDEGNQSDQAKAKLRRLLASQNVGEVCRILRPLLRLIESKGSISIDYASLLSDLLRFNYDESRQRVRERWAQDFYRTIPENEGGLDE